MKNNSIKNILKMIRAVNRNDRTAALALKSAMLGLLVGVNWLEEAIAADMSAAQVVEKLGQSMTAADKQQLVQELDSVIKATQAGTPVSPVTQEALANQLAQLAQATGLSEAELMEILQSAGLPEGSLTALETQIAASYQQIGQVADAEVAQALGGAEGEGVLPVAAGIGLGPLLGVGAGVAAVAGAGGGGGDTAVVPPNIAPAGEGVTNGTLVEDASTPNLTSVVSANFSDADLGDVLNYSQTPAAGNALGGTLTLLTADDSGDEADGSVSYTYSVANSATQSLAAGQTVTESFVITATDDDGATVSQTVTITITGTNDVPTIVSAVAAGDVTEIADLAMGENATLLSDSGTIVFADVDLTNTHQVTSAASEEGYLGTFTAALNQATKTVTWTFNLPDSVVDSFAQGQSLSQAYTITVTDLDGAAVQQMVTVTITGTNDAPVVTTSVGQDAAALSESGNLDDGALVTNAATAAGQLTASDVDAMATQTWSIVGTPSATYGAFTLTPAGAWTYSLDNTLAATQGLREGQTVTQTYNVLVTDDFGATAAETVTITINGTNDSPVVTTSVGQDVATLSENGNLDDGAVVTNVATAAGQLTASDVDTMATQTWSIVGTPSATYGTFTLSPTGAWTYSLDNTLAATQGLRENQTVTQTYNVLVTDDFGATAAETVTITINGTNDVPVVTTAMGQDVGAVTEAGNLDNAVVVPGSPTIGGTLTASDVDTMATQTWSVVSGPAGPAYGTFTLTPAGVWTYALDNMLPATQGLNEGQVVTQVFNVRVTDDFGAFADEVVTVTITGTNDVPVAMADVNTAAAEDTATTVTGSVFTNDVDVDSGEQATITVSQVAGANGAAGIVGVPLQGTYGSLQLNRDGSYTYTLNNFSQTIAGGATAVDTFSYVITDENDANSLPTTLTFRIAGQNDAPVVTTANGQDAGTAVESGNLDNGTAVPGVAIVSGQLTATDIDDGATQTWTVVDAVPNTMYGTFNLQPNGAWTYVLNNDLTATRQLTENEMVTLTYNVQVADDKMAIAPETVTIIIRGTNDSPVVTTAAGQDVATLSENGNLINGMPVLNNPVAMGQLTSTDEDFSDSGMWSIVGTPSATYGTFTLTPAGAWTYTLDNALAATQGLREGQTLTQTYNVLVTDNFGATAVETVTITINGTNDSPVVTTAAGQDVATLSENGTLDNGTVVTNVATAAGQLTASDVDSMATQTWSIVSGPAGPVYGTFTLSPAGAWTYTLDNTLAATQGLREGQPVTQTYNVLVTDDFGATAAETVTITINGTNDGPVVNTVIAQKTGSLIEEGIDATGTAVLGTPIATGQLSATDVDQSSGLTWTVVGTPSNAYGGFVVNPQGMWTYTLGNNLAQTQRLNAGEQVTQSFTVEVRDAFDAISFETVNITITGTNDVPEIAALPGKTGSVTEAGNRDDGVVLPGSSIAVGQLFATDVDAGSNLVWFITDNEPNTQYGNFVLSATGGWTYVLNNDLPATQALAEGMPPVVIEYNVRVSDGKGGTADTKVQITINPTNDSPVVTTAILGKTGTVVEAGTTDLGATVAGTPMIGGQLTATDVDQPMGGVLTWSTVGTPVSAYGMFTLDGLSGEWEYMLDDTLSATKALREGQVITETFNVQVKDSFNAVAFETVTITIRGTNDAPTLTLVNSNENQIVLNAADDDNGATINLQTSIGSTSTLTVGGDNTINLNAGLNIQQIDLAVRDDFNAIGRANAVLGLGTNSGDTLDASGITSPVLVYGFAGNDTITTSAQSDRLYGGEGNDTFIFASAVQLAEDAVVSGGNGADTVFVNTASTIVDSDFTKVTSVETLSLTGASTVTLDTAAQMAGIGNVIAGSGSTSITNNTVNTVNVDASAMPDGTLLTLSGSGSFVVTGVKADVTNTAMGSLVVTLDGQAGVVGVTVNSSGASSVIVNTGTFDPMDTLTLAGADTITVNVDFVTNVVTGAANSIFNIASNGAAGINAAATPDNNSIVITGSGDAFVTGLIADLNASASTGRIEVIALGDTQVITTGAGADVIDAGAGDDTVIAGGGNDVIRGGLGVDSITGDTGDNVYVVVGSLDATDNAKYSNFNGSVVVNGVPIDVSKVVSLAELTTSKMEDDVQSGETINGFGIGDRIVVFGTTDLTKINGGGPIPADIIVNSTVTVDFSQLVTGSTQIAGGLIAGMDTLSKLIILNVPSNGVVNLAQFSFADIETVVLEAAAGQTLENTQVVFSEEFLAVMPAPQVFVKLVGGAEIAAVPGMNIGSVYDDGNFQMAGDGGEQLDGTPEDDVLIGGAGNDIINGVGGNDLIEGRAGADVIDAGSGDDVIVNFEGFDSVQGGDGNDTLQLTKTSSTLALTPDSALQGIEVISASGAAQGVTIDIFRQTEDFQIEGSVFNDTIIAFSGNDTINGGAGADTILGGAGNDTVIVEVAATGFEADSINLGLEKDDKAVFSGAGLTGKEVLVSFVSGAVGSGVTDTVNLQLQDAGANGAMGTVTGDTATLDDEGVVLSGAKFNVIGLSNGALDTANQNRGVFDEVVLGTNANDVDDFSLEAEDYYVNAGAGNDSITTGSGKDFLVGGEGDDTLNAGAGNDSLLGGAGDDTIDGGEGNDTITGGAGADTILGGAGNDTVTLEVAATGFEADSINLGLEKDDKAVFSGAGLTGKEVLVSFVSGAVGSGVANAVNLQLQDAGVNGAVGTVTGGTATLDDEGVVLSGAKFNVIGLSNGALDTANQNRGVFDEVVLGTNANDVDDFSLEAEDYYVNAGAGNDSITTGSGKDFLVGGEGDDTLNAGAGNDSLLGGAGDDNIDGGEGNDTINGGAGADTILGGAGNDTVIVEVAATGFEADSINLGLEKDDKAVFSGAGLTGKEVLVSFVSGAVGSGVTDTVNLQLQDAGANGAMGTVTGDTATLDDEGVVLSGAKFNVIGLSNGALDTANQNRGVFDEVVLGTNANDVDDFSLEAEDYYVNAGAGNDSITTGSGKDFLVGGEGDDTLNAGAGNDSLLGGAGDDNIDGGEGNDAITGGAGNDAINGGLGTDTVSYANAVSVTANATGFVVDAGAEGMDTLNGVEKLVFTVSDGMGGMIAKTFLLVGNGGYATIQAAVDAAAEGDTIVLADETFIGNVLVNKGVTIISANNAGKSGTDAMRTLESVIDGELMITTTSKVVIDGVTFLNNDEYTLDINDNYVAVKVLAHASAASGGHVITNSIFLRDPVDPMGFNPTAFAGSNFQPTHRAVELAKVGAGAAVVVSDNLFTGTNPYFYAGDNWRTGVYSNGGEGSTSIADNTFENVRGALNLDDFGTTVSVTGNNFESAGSAIALGGVPTVATNLTSISGNTFGRVDTDFNGQNLSAAQPVVLDIGAFGGPAIGMIDIAGTLIPEPFTALTGAGNDVVTGSSGNDIITTNAGNDAITGGAGNDAINGGLGTDTVSYANAVSVTANATGFVVDAGAEGMDTLNGVEKLVFTVSDGMGGMIAKTFLLVGNGGYATIQAAVDAAAEGDTIVLADETFIGNVLVNKGVTIISANNAGKSGTDAMRTLESVIDGELMITTTSKVVIDGVTFLNNDEYTLDINDNYVAVKVLAHASAASGGHVITNSIFLRDPVDPMGFNPTAFAGSNFQPTHRAVELAKVGAGAAVVVSDNLFTGTNPYFYAGDNWRTGVYSNGGEGSTSIADNTFENVRGALNLDDFGTTVSVTGNNFESAGSAIALGGVPTVATNLTSISGNTFGRVDTDFNGQNLSAAQPVVLDIGAFGGPAIGMIDIAGTLIPEPFTALTGAGNDVVTGSSGNDIITTNAGNDAITGGAGNDAINGGLGTDTVSYANAVSVTANATGFVVDAGAEGMDTLNGVEKLVFTVSDGMGGMIAKTFLLVGNGGYATIQAAVDAAVTGDETILVSGSYAESVTISSTKAGLTIEGLAGAQLTGGIFVQAGGVSISNLTIREGAVLGSQPGGVVVAASDVSLSDLTLSKSGTEGTLGGSTRGIVNAVGEGANLLISNVTVSGFATGVFLNPGADGAQIIDSTLSSNFVGLSNDDPDNFVITGTDFVDNAFEQIGLGVVDQVEDLSAVVGTGNTFTNSNAAVPNVSIYPLGATNAVQEIIGTGQADQFNGDQTNNGAAQRFEGGAGNDTINLGGGDDIAVGGEGDDTINGGAGQDTLTGGTGSDIFAFTAAGQTATIAATDNDANGAVSNGDTFTGNFDVITDFVSLDNDMIDLSAINNLATPSDVFADLQMNEFQFIKGDFDAGVFIANDAGADTLLAFDDGTNDVGVILLGVESLNENDDFIS